MLMRIKQKSIIQENGVSYEVWSQQPTETGIAGGLVRFGQIVFAAS